MSSVKNKKTPSFEGADVTSSAFATANEVPETIISF
jgi:hypothetical protein